MTPVPNSVGSPRLNNPQPPQPAALKPVQQSSLYRHDRAGSLGRSADSLRTSDSLDLEKDALRYSSRDNTTPTTPKLGGGHGHQSSPRESRHSRHDSILQVKYEIYDEVVEPEPVNKAFKILVFFCGPLSALCLCTLFWTILALLYSVPIQSCRAIMGPGRQNFRGHLLALLAPIYRFQSRCIYHSPDATEYRLSKLLLINFLSPILSLAMVLAGLVAALFWACSAIVGNPGANSDGGNDAREAVMTLRRWWNAWLDAAVVRL